MSTCIYHCLFSLSWTNTCMLGDVFRHSEVSSYRICQSCFHRSVSLRTVYMMLCLHIYVVLCIYMYFVFIFILLYNSFPSITYSFYLFSIHSFLSSIILLELSPLLTSLVRIFMDVFPYSRCSFIAIFSYEFFSTISHFVTPPMGSFSLICYFVVTRG